MTKYMVALVIIILGGLLFINKDKLLSLSATGNEAAVVSSVVGSGSGGQYYTLKTQRLVGDKYGVYRGSGIVTPKGGKYTSGTTAVLTATPDKGSKVVWSAEGCNTKNICKIVMSQDKEIFYAFLPKGNLIKDNCRIEWTSVLTKEFRINCSW